MMITYKAFYWYFYSKEIVQLFQILEANYSKMTKDNSSVTKKLRRSYYLDDNVFFFLAVVICFFMYIAFLTTVKLQIFL